MSFDELIGLMASYPPHLRVVVDGYDEGNDNLSPQQLRVVKITLTTGTREYVGALGDGDNLPKEQLAGLPVEDALALQRASH